MTFSLPAIKDACNISRGGGDPKWLADINSPSNTGTKSAGSLPITGNATEFDGNSNGQIKGYAKEFENGQSPAYDVSVDPKVMLWHSQFNAPNRIQVNTVALGGVRLRLYSGTGSPPTNYREFFLGGRDTPWAECIKGQYPMTIDLNDSSHNNEIGTFDNTNVTSFAILTNRLNMSGGSTNWNYQGKMYLLDTIKSSANTPTFTGISNPQQAVDLIQGSDFTDKLGNWVRKLGAAIFIDMGFRIGDNSTSTQFNDDGATIVSPVANDPNDPRVRVTAKAFRVYVNLRNNIADTATFSGTWIWQTRAEFDFSQSNLAIIVLNNVRFTGMGRFLVGSSTAGNGTWDNAGAVVITDSGANINGSTFKNAFGDHLLELTAGAMNIAADRFESYVGKHAILIDTAGIYNFDSVFFDHSGIDIETTHASGVVTINILNGGTVPTVTQTGAGTVVINNNVNITVKVIDNLTGLELPDAHVMLLLTSDFSTQILNANTNASGIATALYNYSGDVAIEGWARQMDTIGVDYIPKDIGGNITSSGFSTTVRLDPL